MEDRRYLTILDAIANELQGNLVEYNTRANGITDKTLLLNLRTEQNLALVELLQKHRRAMAFMAGEKIEPELHFGEAVLLPVGGLG